jgi:hypothetical protein
MKKVQEYYLDVSSRIAEFEKRNVNSNFLVKKGTGNYAFSIFLRSILDLFLLTIKLINIRFNKKSYALIYTQANLCAFENNQYRERLVNNLVTENRIYVNQGKEKIIKTIDGYKTYNIGGIVDFISRLFLNNSKKTNLLKAYQLVNNYILFFYNKKKVYLLCHYDQCGMSIIFSKFRKKIKLVEVQHGGIINYPAYSKASSIKIVDTFYVRNNETINYLKNHLNSNFQNIEYFIIPYSKNELNEIDGIQILYSSSVEINGFHPVFLDFLKSAEYSNRTITVRLHPREKEKQEVFENVLVDNNVKYKFDNSINWLESNTIKNLIVISPWSSVIEEASDNGFKTIIIDKLGKKRFNYLIDEKTVFYADNFKRLGEIIKAK